MKIVLTEKDVLDAIRLRIKEILHCEIIDDSNIRFRVNMDDGYIYTANNDIQVEVNIDG